MRNKQAGFTLIEILVVLLIVGITFGVAVLAFGDFGESRRILFAAEQFTQSLKLARQQAILENSTFGLKFDSQGYQILKLNHKAWQVMHQQGIFKHMLWPKNTHIHLQSEDNKKNSLPILLHASGEISAFTLTFSNADKEKIAVLTGEHNGNLKLQQTRES